MVIQTVVYLNIRHTSWYILQTKMSEEPWLSGEI